MFYYILIGGTSATVAMTLFSLFVSLIFNQLYREPILINSLLPEKIRKYSLLGYLIHLVVGWLFAATYYLLIASDLMVLSFQSGLVFGLVAGGVAIATWNVFFKMSDNPPKINLIGYFLQLLLAHIVFGGTLAWVVML